MNDEAFDRLEALLSAPIEGKFSMEFCMAILLLERRAGLAEFTDEVVNRPDVKQMIERIDFGIHPNAEAAGYDVRRYAGDRGLAYDLIGQPERAQRDYRLAMQAGANDEVIQRYALSLGIVGQRDAALQLLDPLVRKQDRSAWRTRAFVLAMTGDQPGAEKIVTTMLPQGMAQGLLPFFQRPPALAPADYEFSHVTAEGHYLSGRDALIFMKPPEGFGLEPGYMVVTPFTLSSGGEILVERGFVPASKAEDIAGRAPPSGETHKGGLPSRRTGPQPPSSPGTTA